MKRGRPASTGRFDSREELCKFVWRTYLTSKTNLINLSIRCRVSETTVRKILNDPTTRPVDTDTP